MPVETYRIDEITPDRAKEQRFSLEEQIREIRKHGFVDAQGDLRNAKAYGRNIGDYLHIERKGILMRMPQTTGEFSHYALFLIDAYHVKSIDDVKSNCHDGQVFDPKIDVCGKSSGPFSPWNRSRRACRQFFGGRPFQGAQSYNAGMREFAFIIPKEFVNFLQTQTHHLLEVKKDNTGYVPDLWYKPYKAFDLFDPNVLSSNGHLKLSGNTRQICDAICNICNKYVLFLEKQQTRPVHDGAAQQGYEGGALNPLPQPSSPQAVENGIINAAERIARYPYNPDAYAQTPQIPGNVQQQSSVDTDPSALAAAYNAISAEYEGRRPPAQVPRTPPLYPQLQINTDSSKPTRPPAYAPGPQLAHDVPDGDASGPAATAPNMNSTGSEGGGHAEPQHYLRDITNLRVQAIAEQQGMHHNVSAVCFYL